MSLPRDLLGQAKLLASKEPRRPKQASLRRSVSAAYYALFHLLVEEGATLLVGGKDRTPLRNCVRRAFQHSTMKQVAAQFAKDKVSDKLNPGLDGQPLQNEIKSVAQAFVDLQQLRHEADYDMTRRFTRREVLDLLDDAETAFADWKSVRKSVQADTFLVGLLVFTTIRT